jgi:hydrogenase maturation protein HypF
MIKRIFIKVAGIVQGVGFRPFVYNKAMEYSIKGWVNNNSQGVFIDAEGEEDNLNSLLNSIEKNPPPLSKVDSVSYEELDVSGFSSFTIKESEREIGRITLISPDVSTCRDCFNDINDKNNRRYGYPFTNCTNCGPRFTIIKSIPYDRDKTTMSKFKMCPECSGEYKNPSNRRFHAQPNACEICGPHLFIGDSNGNSIVSGDTESLDFTRNMLKQGKIFAVKGLGGFHLCCDAKNADSIMELRKRKKREDKPFAVMAKDISVLSEYCVINDEEKETLEGIRKPILILKRKKEYSLPEDLAPGQTTLGAMLPYTPLHFLLFKEGIDVLVMTSANISSLPLEYDNDKAFENLNGIVDFFLFHDRDIHISIDDSVARYIHGKIRLIRRARGYVPDPYNFEIKEPILAMGPNMKNTFALNKEGYIFLSQFNGDLENIETVNHYKRNIKHMSSIFSFTPKYIAVDYHPNYESTKYGEDLSTSPVRIYHHHAHIVSCMVENNLDENVIGISFDGTGYGTDGKIWGSEFLISGRKSFQRSAHLEYVPLQGGDKSVIEPYRMAISYIMNSYPYDEAFKIVSKLYGEKGLTILNIIKNKINCIDSCSIGRLFDAVSSLIGIKDIINYEGQAAIELEAKIKPGNYQLYPYEIDDSIIKTDQIIRGILEDRVSKIDIGIISAKFHNTIIDIILKVCCSLREKHGINKVALSGGVFQNAYLLSNSIDKLEEAGFEVFTQSLFPSNDGGIALGQIVAASLMIENKCI